MRKIEFDQLCKDVLSQEVRVYRSEGERTFKVLSCNTSSGRIMIDLECCCDLIHYSRLKRVK